MKVIGGGGNTFTLDMLFLTNSKYLSGQNIFTSHACIIQGCFSEHFANLINSRKTKALTR